MEDKSTYKSNDLTLYDCVTLMGRGDFGILKSINKNEAIERIFQAINDDMTFIASLYQHTANPVNPEVELPLPDVREVIFAIDLNYYSGEIATGKSQFEIDGLYKGDVESIPELDEIRKRLNDDKSSVTLETILLEEEDGQDFARIVIYFLGES